MGEADYDAVDKTIDMKGRSIQGNHRAFRSKLELDEPDQRFLVLSDSYARQDHMQMGESSYSRYEVPPVAECDIGYDSLS